MMNQFARAYVSLGLNMLTEEAPYINDFPHKFVSDWKNIKKKIPSHYFLKKHILW